MSWRPLTNKHAIERVRVIVQFSEAVPAKLSKAMSDQTFAIRHDLRFTGPTSLQSFGLRISPQGGEVLPQPERGQGWQYMRAASNRAPLEVLTLDGETLIYETAEYQRWEQFRRRSEKILLGPVSSACAAVDIASLSIEYYDRFVYHGLPETAPVADLLIGVADNLHPDARAGRTVWHLHKGWFETVPSGGRALINQNFDASDGMLQGSSEITRSVGILTKAELRSDSNNLDHSRLSVNLEKLHDLTKMYFKNAIHPDMHDSVGIK